MKHVKIFEEFLNEETQFPAQFEIGEPVSFKTSEDDEERWGSVVKVSFTKAKVFYDILDDYTSTVVEFIDSAFIKTLKGDIKQEEPTNEAKFSAGGFTCTIIGGHDTKGSYISFIPDSKTLDNYTTEESVRWIDQVFNNMDFFRDCMQYEPKHNAAGYVFRFNASDLADLLVKEFKA